MFLQKGEMRVDDKYVRQFKKGSLEMILLSLIGRGETYGYELIAALNRDADVLGYAREGTVYPILYRLEENGWIACRIGASPANGGQKKYYSLTEQGREALNELTAFWKAYAACVNRFIETEEEP